MPGGLFAINREYFMAIGMYDPGLKIWGGENFELSYKLWMCGGRILFVPCSRAGHIYRLPEWHGNEKPVQENNISVTLINYMRVVEVWWDDWKKVFSELKSDTVLSQNSHIPKSDSYSNSHILFGLTKV